MYIVNCLFGDGYQIFHMNSKVRKYSTIKAYMTDVDTGEEITVESYRKFRKICRNNKVFGCFIEWHNIRVFTFTMDEYNTYKELVSKSNPVVYDQENRTSSSAVIYHNFSNLKCRHPYMFIEHLKPIDEKPCHTIPQLLANDSLDFIMHFECQGGLLDCCLHMNGNETRVLEFALNNCIGLLIEHVNFIEDTSENMFNRVVDKVMQEGVVSNKTFPILYTLSKGCYTLTSYTVCNKVSVLEVSKNNELKAVYNAIGDTVSIEYGSDIMKEIFPNW